MIDEGGVGWIGAAREGVIYIRVRKVFDREIVDATRRLHVLALTQRPEGCVMLFDAITSIALPRPEVLDYAATMAARYQDGIRAHVTVLSGGGFFASAIRGAISGIFMIAHNPYPRTVVATPEEGVKYLRSHLRTPSPTEASMLDAYRALPTFE